jgi:High potential iron-sulfur protein
MNKDGNDWLRISRRVALSRGAAALGSAAIATVVSQAAAQQKISQADATYQSTPKGGQHCEGCVNFQPPNTCKFVDGNVSPSGWCQLFTPKS